MIRAFALSALALALGACDGTDPCDVPPTIRPNTSPLIVCQQTEVFEVPILIENKGCDDLVITGAAIRGDIHESFGVPELAGFSEGELVIPPEGEGFVRVSYAPTAVSEDHIWLTLKSNAANVSGGDLVIPICGPGATAGPNAVSCVETTQCADGLSCMRSNRNSILEECVPGEEAVDGQECFCQARQCMNTCRCPPGTDVDGCQDPPDAGG